MGVSDESLGVNDKLMEVSDERMGEHSHSLEVSDESFVSRDSE